MNAQKAARDVRPVEEMGEKATKAEQGESPKASSETDTRKTASPASRTAMDRVRMARHADRPYTLDYVERLFDDFMELHGDRKFGEDPAIIAGFGRFRGEPVAVVGHQKGRTMRERQYRNFGMPKPEGYRKALRVMELAEKFDRPILTLIDTPGAYPGIDAEERGQAEAIAFNLREMAKLRVPIICTVTGEGGSGGALAIGVGDWVQMLENSVYSVITPEGCAAILWKDAGEAARAAEALKITAEELVSLGVVDAVVPEPGEGAHTDYDRAAELLGDALASALDGVRGLGPGERRDRRYEKFRRMGRYSE